MKEYEKLERIGTMPHRCYYIPFSPDDKAGTTYGIIDRTTSSRFMSLDGIWQIKQHDHIEDFDIGEELTETIPVPSCVQMHGYDHIQYVVVHIFDRCTINSGILLYLLLKNIKKAV